MQKLNKATIKILVLKINMHSAHEEEIASKVSSKMNINFKNKPETKLTLPICFILDTIKFVHFCD